MGLRPDSDLYPELVLTDRMRGMCEPMGETEIRHPTVKPLPLMEWLIELVTRPGMRVLDPFAGTGSTLEAGRALGRRMVGCELDTLYLPLIAQRLGNPVQGRLL